MSKTNTSITYSGKALEGGMMEVRDFATSILAFAEICQLSYTALTGKDDDISVAINSEFKKGSFEVDLVIALFYDAAMRHSAGLAARYLIDSILKVLGIRKNQKDSPITLVEKNGKIYVYEKNKKSYSFELDIWQGKLIFSSYEQYEKLVSPVNKKDMDGISIGKDELKIEKQDIINGPGTVSMSQKMQVEIITPQLDGYRKWRFKSKPKGESFFADMNDENFLFKVISGEIQFRSGDVLQVIRLTRKSMKGGKLKEEHTITEVISE